MDWSSVWAQSKQEEALAIVGWGKSFAFWREGRCWVTPRVRQDLFVLKGLGSFVLSWPDLRCFCYTCRRRECPCRSSELVVAGPKFCLGVHRL